MKKITSSIVAISLAASMLVTEASAVLAVPEGNIASGCVPGSGMWLVQLYNVGNPEENKPATDYGIDYSAVSSVKFTIGVDKDDPTYGDNWIDVFEGGIGGSIVFSCNGGDIVYPDYEEDTSSDVSYAWDTYNWQSQYWWGISDDELGLYTDPMANDDPTDDGSSTVSSVALGDATYSLTAEFVNPLSCETDDWNINEIACMQVCLQEYGQELVPIEVLKCEILDKDGGVLLWFDGNGNANLENIAADDNGSTSYDEYTFYEGDTTEEKYYKFLNRVKSVRGTLTVNSFSPADSGLYSGFYMQNYGGDWLWFADEYQEITGEGSYDIVWENIQNLVGGNLYWPIEEWEATPSFGVVVGSNGITEVGMEGAIDSSISNVVITLTDDTEIEIPSFEVSGDLLGVEEAWGLAGNEVQFNMADLIKAEIENMPVYPRPETPDDSTQSEEHPIYAGFYMQNYCEGYEWFQDETQVVQTGSAGNTYSLSWNNVQDTIYADVDGVSTCLLNMTDPASPPALGFVVNGNYNIGSDQYAHLDLSISNIRITLEDGTELTVSNISSSMPQKGPDYFTWSFGMEYYIMTECNLTCEEYYEMLKKVVSVTADFTIEKIRTFTLTSDPYDEHPLYVGAYIQNNFGEYERFWDTTQMTQINKTGEYTFTWNNVKDVTYTDVDGESTCLLGVSEDLIYPDFTYLVYGCTNLNPNHYAEIFLDFSNVTITLDDETELSINDLGGFSVAYTPNSTFDDICECWLNDVIKAQCNMDDEAYFEMLKKIESVTLDFSVDSFDIYVEETNDDIDTPEDTGDTNVHPGASISSDMYLVQLYNVTSDAEQPIDYGIDYSTVSRLRFTIKPNDNDPVVGDSYGALFEGLIGGGVVLSCGGGDISLNGSYSGPTGAVAAYNWATESWWGVTDDELGIYTDPLTNDDPEDDENLSISTVALGNYTYQLTADFINPLTCETDEWEINEIGYMQAALQQWGSDQLPFAVTKCEVFDAEGNVLIWFDEYGNPSLDNTLAEDGGESGGSSGENSYQKAPISLSGATTTVLNEEGNVDGSLYRFDTYTVNGLYALAPTDKISITIAPTDSTVDTSSWKIALNAFDINWSGWQSVISTTGAMSLKTTVKNVMDAIDCTDTSDFGGFVLQVWDTDADVQIDWTLEITSNGLPEDEDDDDNVFEGYDDAYAKIYMQNYAGDWKFFSSERDTIFFGEEGTYELGWYDIQNVISTTEDGVKTYLFKTPEEEWESYPAFGIDIGSLLITEEGQTGKIVATVSDFTIHLLDGTSYTLADFEIGGELVGVLQDEVFSGANIMTDLSEIIKNELDLDNEDYLEMLKSVDYVTSTLTVDEFVALDDTPEDPVKPDENSEYNAYIGFNTLAWSFRNKWWSQEYGKDSEYFDKVVVWGEPDTYPEYSDYYNYDIEGYVIPATFSDAKINGNGTYKVGIYDFDWALDNSDGFNTLFVSTDIPNSEDISISDIRIIVDGEETAYYTGSYLYSIEDNADYIDIILVNIWDGTLDSYDGEYPTESLEIEFTVNGLPEEEISDSIDSVENFAITNTTPSSITLGWDKNNSAEGYIIEQYISGKWTQIADIDDNATTEHEVTGLTPDTAYKFRIKAYNSNAEGNYTDTLTATTQAVKVEGFTSPSKSTTAIRLGWTKNAYATGYIVEQYDGTKWVQIADITDNTTVTYKVTDLKPGTAYKFRMKAYYVANDDIMYGDKTDTLTVNTDMTTVKDFKSSSKATTAIRLNWTKNAYATGYIIEQYDGENWVQIADITDNKTVTYKVTDLKPGTAYKFRMKAYSVTKYGETIESDKTDTLTINTDMTAVKGFKSPSKSTTAVRLNWTANNDATGYIIEQYDGKNWVQIANITDNTIATYKVTDLNPGTAYKFRMKAYSVTKYDETIYGDKTATITVNTDMTAVNDFAGIGKSTTTINLSWTENAYATGYIIEQYNGKNWVQIADITKGSTTTYKVSGLKVGTAYKFRMKAYSVTKYGETIYGDKTATITVNTLTSAISGFTLKSRSSSALRLKWTKNTAVDGYIIEQYINNEWVQIADIDNYATTEYKVTGLKASASYKFRMKSYAITKYGEKAYSAYTSVLTKTTSPSVASSLKVKSRAQTAIRLAWSKNTSATGYLIEQYIDGNWVQVAKIESNATLNHRIDGLKKATTYKFRVRTYNVVNNVTLYSDYKTINAATSS